MHSTRFEVVTGSNSLTYVLITVKLDATGQQRTAALLNYNFVVKYRRGKKNAEAKCLSRYKKIIKKKVVFSAVPKSISYA